VHLIRSTMNYMGWKDREVLAAELEPIYQVSDATAAKAALRAFELGALDKNCPPMAQAGRRQWTQVIPFFAYPPEMHRIIYTTNAIEILHMRLRKIVTNHAHFSSDEAASKLLYFALRNIIRDWGMSNRPWKEAANQLAVIFCDRFTQACNEAAINPMTVHTEFLIRPCSTT
jgi:putative transposase